MSNVPWLILNQMKAMRGPPQLWQTNALNNLKPIARDQKIRFKFPNVSNGKWKIDLSFFSGISGRDDSLTLALLFTKVKIIDKGLH